MSTIFITGIGTDVGKTVVSAIVTQALKADYWKPVQSGLEDTDRGAIATLVDNHKTNIHPEAYRLKTAMSPHKAAEIDGVTIELSQIKRPETKNKLVVEGAGGLLVPLNNKHMIIDLIEQSDKVILVSSGYLGSINHTLLSAEVLKSRSLNCVGIIYNHIDLDGTIEIIEKMTGIPTLGTIKWSEKVNPEMINSYAEEFKNVLESL